MPRFIKDGQPAVETSVPREAAELRAGGYTEQKAKTAAVKESDAAKPATTPSK